MCVCVCALIAVCLCHRSPLNAKVFDYEITPDSYAVCRVKHFKDESVGAYFYVALNYCASRY